MVSTFPRLKNVCFDLKGESYGCTGMRPKSLGRAGASAAGARGTVRALYAYLSSGEHQMSFLEGDLIVLLAEESVAFRGK